MSIIQAAGSGEVSTGFYSQSIGQSLRFDDGDSPALSKTYSTAQTNTKKLTISVWVKRGNLGIRSTILYAVSGSAGKLSFQTTDKIYFNAFNTGYNGFESNALFKDTSSWYHIVAQADSDGQTGANVNRVYVNGVELANGKTSTFVPDDTATMLLRNGVTTYIGDDTAGAYHFDGYLAEMHVIDGSVVAPTEFAETKDNIWIPKAYSGSYGDNGFRLDFADSSAIGNDVSGQNNDFTVSGGGSPTLVASDVVPDSPTNNFATLNSLALGADGTLSDGNLKIVYGTSSTRSITTATMGVSSGKWYWEVLPNSDGGEIIGVTSFSNDTGLYPGVAAGSAGYYGDDGSKYVDGSNSSYGASFATDIIGFALDMDAGTLVAYKNNSSQGTLVSSLTGNIFPAIGDGGAGGTSSNTFNFGQDSSFAGAKTAQGNADSNGVGDFYYAPPSGFLALAFSNLPEPDIIDSTEHFNTVLYQSNGGTNAITGMNFKADFLWIKQRTSTNSHAWTDSLRGVTKALSSNLTNTEYTYTNGMQSFDSDGFTLNGNNGWYNSSTTRNYVAWGWLAGGTPTATNSAGAGNAPTSGSVMIDGVASTSALAGTIPATKISANTTAGFSVISYTGNGSSGQTVAHGLSSAPEFIIHKDRESNSNNNNWNIYHAGAGDKYGYFLVNAFTGSAQIIPNGTDTIELKTNLATSNESGDDFIMYAFHSVEGYSKFGTYTGNNTFNFVYTGFRPAFVILKKVTASQTYGWQIYDAKRSPINVALFPGLWADTNAAEAANTYYVNIHSTGFRLTGAGNNQNQNGVKYIYIAIADQPAKFANAR